VFLRSPLRIIATLKLPETARADFRRTRHVRAAINAWIHNVRCKNLKCEMKKGQNAQEPSRSVKLELRAIKKEISDTRNASRRNTCVRLHFVIKILRHSAACS